MNSTWYTLLICVRKRLHSRELLSSFYLSFFFHLIAGDSSYFAFFFLYVLFVNHLNV